MAAGLALLGACTAPNPDHNGKGVDDRDGGVVDDGARAPDTGGAAGLDAAPRDLPPATPDSPGASSLVGWWKLDESANTAVAADSSGAGHHGRLEGLDPSTAWVAGKHGGALSWPAGGKGGVQIPLSVTLMALRQITVAAWMKRVPASAAIETQNTIVSQQDESQATAETFSLQAIREDLQGFIITSSAARPAGSSSGLRVSGVATRQVWTHVAMTYDGSTVRLFRNGVELGSEDIGRPLVPSSKPFYIGLNENGSSVQAFEGQLDDVVIYNRPLPATAIMALADGASPAGF
jgi:hypothetical protein